MGIINNLRNSLAVRNAVQQTDGFNSTTFVNQQINPNELFFGGINKAGAYDNFYGDKLAKNLRIVEAMRPIAEAHGVPVSSIAVRWILDTLPNSAVITGVKSPAQAEANAQALRFALTADELKTLNSVSAA